MIDNEINNDPQQSAKYFAAKLAFTLGPFELNQSIHKNDKFNIIDVRHPEDYAKGHIPGAKNLPQNNWDSSFFLDKNKIHVFYCYSQQCHLAAKAAYHFSKLDYHVMELEGGYKTWVENEFPVEI